MDHVPALEFMILFPSCFLFVRSTHLSRIRVRTLCADTIRAFGAVKHGGDHWLVPDGIRWSVLFRTWGQLLARACRHGQVRNVFRLTGRGRGARSR